MVLGQQAILMQKDESGHLLYTYIKTNSKWIKGLNTRAKTTKLLGKKIQVNHHDHELGNNFLHMTSKAKQVLVTQLCPTLCDPWTVAHQAPLSMGFSRQEYLSELPFPSPLKPSNQSKNIYIEFHKIKTFCSSKDTTRQQEKDNIQNGRKSL